MPQETLAQKIRAKYPDAYTDLTDAQLEAAIDKKYPGTYADIPRTQGETGQRSGAMSDADWSALTPGERARNMLQWGGNVIAGMTGMGTAGREAVENPKTTLATAAVPLAIKGVASAIPTTAKAGAKFQQVARAAGNQPVDTGGAVGTSALRIAELGERGATMPKVARQFLNRITDPSKGDLTYTEARDFYSNISRLSAADAMKTSPVIHREMGNLRAALDKAVEAAAAKGGQAENYRQAMRQYAIASRIKSIASKIGQHAGKGAAGAVGVGAGYSAWKALSD